MNIKKEISENNIIVLIIPNKKYPQVMENTVKALSDVYSKLCYVSLNRSYDKITEDLQKSGVDANKFFFIDCVTKKIKEPSKNVLFVTSPGALTEMNITINKVLDSGEVPLTIFDSLSTLLAYEGSMIVIKFVHSIVSAFRSYGTKCIFTCMKDDVNIDLMKDLSMFADKIVKAE